MERSLFEKLRSAAICWLAHRLPDCKTTVIDVGDELDGRASFRTRLVTRVHLLICEACRRYREQIGFLRLAMQAGETRSSSMRLSAETKGRLKRLMTTTCNDSEDPRTT
jgi:hypothetical protein